MMLKAILRSLASSPLNPLAKIESFSVKNGNLGPFSYFSTAALPKGTMFQRLIDATNPKIRTPKVPISQILQQWVDEGRELDIDEINEPIERLTQLRRYSHALQISECVQRMGNRRLTPAVAMVQLDLIAKVKGLEEAEKYYESVPGNSNFFHTHRTLLELYVHAKALDKAEAIMQKMRNLRCAYNICYNVMLGLYFQLGKLEKLNSLVLEMENKGIKYSRCSYKVLLKVYLSASDTIGMDKLLMKIKADAIDMDWKFYSNAANGYLKAGDIGKAEIMLKKSDDSIYVEIFGYWERKKAALKRRNASQVLMAQYARIGRKDAVLRLWQLHKKRAKFCNRSYSCIIMALLTLGEVDGAQKMLDKWLSKKVKFEIGVPNLLVTTYCEKGHLEKAEAIIRSVMKIGEVPNARTWCHLALAYCKKNQMEDAVEILKWAITSRHPGWRPDLRILASCLRFLKENGNPAGAEEIMALLVDVVGCKFSDDYLSK